MTVVNEIVQKSKIGTKLYNQLNELNSIEAKIEYLKDLSNFEQKVLSVHILANIKKNLITMSSKDLLDYSKRKYKLHYNIKICTKEHYLCNIFALLIGTQNKMQDKIAIKLIETMGSVSIKHYLSTSGYENAKAINKILDQFSELSAIGIKSVVVVKHHYNFSR